MTTRIYFVRHALPIQEHADDRTRPLTEEGLADSALVRDFLRDKNIGVFYLQPVQAQPRYDTKCGSLL
jgi:phosphohistidine phosphatase SixA